MTSSTPTDGGHYYCNRSAAALENKLIEQRDRTAKLEFLLAHLVNNPFRDGCFECESAIALLGKAKEGE